MRLFFVFAVLGFFTVFAPLEAYAQKIIPGSSCSEDYLEVMKNRAWIQGKREMEMAQTLILKQDSVLEYSCFEQRRRQLGRGSVGSQWIDTSSAGIKLMDFVDDLVGGSLESYVRGSFGHVAAGGRYDAATTGVCDLMYQVWDFMRCTNFEEDSFMTLELLSKNEIRNLPGSCAFFEAKRDEKWVDALAAAYPAPGKSGAVLPVSLKFGMFNSGNCGGVTPVETGVTVAALTPGAYPDKVCPAPGCYYDQAAGTCK